MKQAFAANRIDRRWPGAFAFIALFAAGQAVAEGFDSRRFLNETVPFLRPVPENEVLALAQELAARDQPRASRALLSTLSSKPDTFARWTRQCLQWGILPAAEALLDDWRRRYPDDPRLGLYASVQLEESGSVELARRALLGRRRTSDAKLEQTLRLREQLLEMKLRGQKPGTDANPWKVEWGDPSPDYVPGRLAAAEAAKLPPDALATLSELLLLSPRDGSLWGLLAELLNASGDTAGALEAMKRAEITGYTPRALLAHRRRLEQYQREQASAAEARLTAAAAARTPANEEPADSPDRRGIRVVLAIGGVLVAAIALLQIREWLRPFRRPSP